MGKHPVNLLVDKFIYDLVLLFVRMKFCFMMRVTLRYDLTINNMYKNTLTG
jgi:hypothetical protein